MLSGSQHQLSPHLQLAELIREEIIAEEFKPGDQLPSQQHLATRFRTSLITVKRALNQLKAEGVVYGEPGKGIYVNSPIASWLPVETGETTVGLLIEPPTSPFFTGIGEGICDAASEWGWNVFLPDGEISSSRSDLSEALGERDLHGLIFGTRVRGVALQEAIARVRRWNRPFVMISYTDDPEVDYVGVDHVRGAYLASQHLINLGYRRICFVTPEPDHPLSALRYEGFRQAVRGVEDVEVDVLAPETDEEMPANRYRAGYELGLRLADVDPLPEACFAFTDLVALGLIRALRESAIEVPDEVAVVGFDDIALAELSVVPLTTVRQPLKEIGRRAVEILRRRMKGEPGVTRLLLEPELVVRDSCGASLRGSL